MVDEEIKEKVSNARLKLLFKAQWLAILSYYLKMKPNPNMPIPTMRTDGVYIEYHPEFVRKNDIDAITTVIVHETLHCALQHIFRGKNFNPLISNIASDYACNWIIKDSGFQLYEGMLYSRKYHGWTFEEIYRDLIEKFEQALSKYRNNPQQQGGQADRPQTTGAPSEGDTEEGEGGTSSSSEAPKLEPTSSVETDPDDLIDKIAKGIAHSPFDEHVAPGSLKDGEEEGNTKEQKDGIPSEVEKRRDIEERMKKLKQEWKARISGIKQRGVLPAGMKRVIEDFLHPKLPWKTLLYQYVEKLLKADFSWCPPNRKHIYRGEYLPRMNPDEHIEIAVGLDTSGSVSYEELREFVSELRGIVQSFKTCKLHLFPCDAEVFDYIEVESFNGDVNWESIKERIGGGGGTDFNPVFREVEKRGLDTEIKALIYITDGMGAYPKEAPGYPVLWVIKGKYPREKIPFGDVVYFEDY